MTILPLFLVVIALIVAVPFAYRRKPRRQDAFEASMREIGGQE